ncbi:flagellar basal-body MS-ring/collar protein FliF [Sphingomonas morindae]|uniref:Flagellar M-ring protein n=1 Tax=Sphingomonas morindae TaxID=1541170 RepID=A0ABY4XCJ2_9SPHN|nr:flagellar basal-body MS-ring/collar protein FliF [Sphingomonas morindae]USI74466.1 flagellar M-ring protein FliF [Sphingomonas morindae]
MGGVGVALLLGIAALAFRTATPAMGFLFTDLDASAAQAISGKLKAQNVPFLLSNDGKAVLAPVDKLPELRMSLAAERLGGKIGYEVLDQEEPFGVSASRARLNETRAIEGELAKSIQSLDHVERARVHIVMPERELFATEARKATAAVTVRTNGRLPPEAVQAIRYLVASSVPDLLPSSVSLVDQTGALLARAGEEGIGAAGDLDAQQAAIEARLRTQIEQMLEPILGHGRVRAEVAATLDREQTRQEAESYDPDKQVIARQVTMETSERNDADSAGAEGASVASQLPEANGARLGGGSGESQRSARKENSEDTSFQNSRTQTVSVRAPGRLERLSVAVMVDGGAKGLAPPELQRLTRLVENAVGYDPGRGDTVAVEAMRFTAAEAEAERAGALPFGITASQLFDLAKWVVLAIGIAVAARYLRGRQRPYGRRATDQLLPPVDLREPPEPPALPPGAAQPALPPLEAAQDLTLLDQEIAHDQIEGGIRLSVIKRLGEAIARSPAESTAVIRQWMNA